MELSVRLSMIEELLDTPVRCLGDVGTDHARLPMAAILHGKAASAVASDIRKGPLAAAARNIGEYGLTDRIMLRLCSGLDGYAPGECDAVVVAGMGGHLICEILEKALSEGRITSAQRFIVAPHTAESVLRTFLYRNGFNVLRENACEEAGHVYLAISCVYDGEIRNLTEKEAVLGICGQLPGCYYENILRKARKRIAGLAAGRLTQAGMRETLFLNEVIREAEAGILKGGSAHV